MVAVKKSWKPEMLIKHVISQMSPQLQVVWNAMNLMMDMVLCNQCDEWYPYQCEYIDIENTNNLFETDLAFICIKCWAEAVSHGHVIQSISISAGRYGNNDNEELLSSDHSNQLIKQDLRKNKLSQAEVLQIPGNKVLSES